MKPWIDRRILVSQAEGFVKRYGFFIRKHAKRISGLVEVAIYNSVVEYYDDQGYVIAAQNLGPKKSFKYRLKSSGLIESFSSFKAIDVDAGDEVVILHNVKLESAHDDHLYYTPDVIVCRPCAAVTKKQKSGTRHSYVTRDGCLTFIEVKHLVPSPEWLFSFTGLVLEFTPEYIGGHVKTTRRGIHLTPTLVFTGVPSKHSERIAATLRSRYGINVICGTQRTDGRIASFNTLNKHMGIPTKPSTTTK